MTGGDDTPVRVLIVDDQAMIRVGLRTILDSHPQLAVVGDVGDGFAALEALVDLRPDVVLMDIRMPGIDGVETVRRIRQRTDAAARVAVIVLTTFDQDEHVIRAVRAGADGFIGKGAGPDELTSAVLRVAEGGRVLSSRAIDAVVGHVAVQRIVEVDEDAVARLSTLTDREREVVQAIVDGYDNERIAKDLFLSPFTVKTHANRAMTKAGVRDRAQLVTLAIRAGVTPA